MPRPSHAAQAGRYLAALSDARLAHPALGRLRPPRMLKEAVLPRWARSRMFL
ncbi:hypothetical protein FRAAL0217 [Frankia alni ACN14a]|uniref:Uncharacterized protein n=1 Tax=Frankia alni (strain DSM 45986 / CECT 9034 / ACN14a) TaxID=326424 RepID=Q0RU49_FRAAA|nr:hypothetical protein FRAAL0217 [Frankia alni ACN14a]